MSRSREFKLTHHQAMRKLLCIGLIMLVSDTLHANPKGNNTSRPKLSGQHHAGGNRRLAGDYWRDIGSGGESNANKFVRGCNYTALAGAKSERLYRDAFAARLARDCGSRPLLHILLSGVSRPGESDSCSCAVAEPNVGVSGDDPLVDQFYSLSALPYDVRAIVVSGAADVVRCRSYLADVGGVRKAAVAEDAKGGRAKRPLRSASPPTLIRFRKAYQIRHT